MTKKQVKELRNFVNELALGKGNHLTYSAQDIPDVIREFLGTPCTVNIRPTVKNGLFGSHKFLSIARQRALTEIFDGDEKETDAFFLSLLIAELCKHTEQKNTMPNAEIIALLKRIQKLSNIVQKTPFYSDKEAHLETLEEMQDLLQSRLFAMLPEENARRFTDAQYHFAFPPLLWKIFDAGVASQFSNPVFFDKVLQGVERSLGKEVTPLLNAAKEEYKIYKEKAGIIDDDLLKDVTTSEKVFTFFACGLLQIAVFSLIFIALQAVLPGSGFLAALPFLLASELSLDSLLFIPEKSKKIYNQIWDQIIYAVVPYFLECVYKFVLTNQQKEELRNQVLVLDACSFKTAYGKKDEGQSTQSPGTPSLDAVNEIHSRLELAKKDVLSRGEDIDEAEVPQKTYPKSLLSRFRESPVAIASPDELENDSFDATQKRLALWQQFIDGETSPIDSTDEKKTRAKAFFSQYADTPNAQKINPEETGSFFLEMESNEDEKHSFARQILGKFAPTILEKVCGETENESSDPIMAVISSLREKVSPSSRYENRPDEQAPPPEISDTFTFFFSSLKELVNTPEKVAQSCKSKEEITGREELPGDAAEVERLSYYCGGNTQFLTEKRPPLTSDEALLCLEFIHEIDKECQEPSIKVPDDLFNYLDHVESIYKKQMSALLPLLSHGNLQRDREIVWACRSYIAQTLNRAVQKIDVFDQLQESAILTSGSWTVSHTNKLSRFFHKLRHMEKLLTDAMIPSEKESFPMHSEAPYNNYIYKNRTILDTPNIKLFLAVSSKLVEELLMREHPQYEPFNVYYRYLYSLRYQNINGLNKKERALLEKLVIAIPNPFAKRNPSIIRKNYPWSKSLGPLYEKPINSLEKIMGSEDIYSYSRRKSMGTYIARARKNSPMREWVEKRTTILPQPVHDLIDSTMAMSYENVDFCRFSTSVCSTSHPGMVHESKTISTNLDGNSYFGDALLEEILITLKEGDPINENSQRSLNYVLQIYFFYDVSRHEENLASNPKLCEKLLCAFYEVAFTPPSSALFVAYLEIICKKHHPQLYKKVHKPGYTSTKDLLIMNAYLSSIKPVESISPEEWELIEAAVFQNRFSPFLLPREIVDLAFLHVQKKRNDPKFIAKMCNVIRKIKGLDPIDFSRYRYIQSSDKITFVQRDNPAKSYIFNLSELRDYEKNSEEEVSHTIITKQGIRPLKAIVLDEEVYYPLKIENKDKTHYEVALRIAEKKRYLAVHKDKKLVTKICLDPAITDEMLAHAVVLQKAPFLLFPMDKEKKPRIPPILQNFSRGTSSQLLQSAEGKVYLLLGDKDPLLFALEEGGVSCDFIPGSQLSTLQKIQNGSLLGSFLVLERDGTRYALYKKNGILISLLSLVESSLFGGMGQNINSFTSLFPELSALLNQYKTESEHGSYDCIPLSDDGYFLPNTTDHFSLLFGAYYGKDLQKFRQTVDLLLQKIELQEPLPGDLSLTHSLSLLAILQLLKGDLTSGNEIMRLTFTYLQSLEINKVQEKTTEKATLLALIFPTYLSYVNTKYYTVHPLPEDLEVIFLNEMFTLLNESISPYETRARQSSLDPFSLMDSLSKGCVHSLLFTIFSDEFQQHLSRLDDVYPQPGKDSLISRLVQFRKKSIKKSSATHWLTRPNMLLLNEMGKAINLVGLKALSCWTKRENFLLQGDAPQKPLELDYQRLDDKTVSQFFHFFTHVLCCPSDAVAKQYQQDLETINQVKASLSLRLQTAIVPPTPSFKHLRFLQQIYRKEQKKELPPFPLERHSLGLVSMLKKIHATLEEKPKLEEDTLNWGMRQGETLLRESMTQENFIFLGKYALNQLAPTILPAVVNSARIDEYANTIFSKHYNSISTKRTQKEMSGQYALPMSLGEDNTFLYNIFKSVGKKYFTAETKTIAVPRHLGKESKSADQGLEKYSNTRIEESYREYRDKMKTQQHYTPLESFDKSSLTTDIQALKTSLEKEIALFSTQILNVANKKAIVPVGIDELYNFALEPDGADCLAKQVSCTKGTAELLLSRITLLALYKTYVAKAKLVLDTLMKEDDPEKIAARLFEQKHYSIDLSEQGRRFTLGCLFFEAKGSMWLRPLQARQMKKANETPDTSLVIEMIPGSGKTAFGAILDLYHNWKKGTLSLAIFTKELVTSMKSDLADRFYKLTGNRAFFMTIDRQKETEESLRHLLHRFKIAQAHGDIIISTKEDLQAIELMLIESMHYCMTYKSSDAKYIDAERKIPYLKELLTSISSSSSIIDECHEILRPDEVEKYPLGHKHQLNSSLIFGMEKCFQFLVEYLIEMKKNSFEGFDDDAKEYIVTHFLEQAEFPFSEKQKEEIRPYLTSMEKSIPSSLETHPLLEVAVTLRGVINELLPGCAHEKIHVTFGLSKENPSQEFAIPYSGNNTPVEGAIFESPYETLCKTYLYFLKEGIEGKADKLSERVQNNIKAEINGLKMDEKHTSIGQFCIHRFGTLTPTKEDFEKNPLFAALLYVSLNIAPNITYYPTSIESTSMNFDSMLGMSHYFSGTIYNESVYPQNLKVVRSKETTAQTLDIVSKRVKEKGSIISLPQKDARAAFLHAAVNDPNCMMLIDSGAIFNGLTNKSVVLTLAEALKKYRPDIKAIIFFDERNTMQAFSIATGSVVPYNENLFTPKERFSYLDQMHTFGVDIPQIEGAGAQISIGNNVLAEIEQACWRLRGLETMGQYVSFCCLPEVPLHKHTFEELVSYLVKTEYKKLQPHSLQATLHSIRNNIRKTLMKKIRTESISIGQACLQEFKELFIEESFNAPVDRYGNAKSYRQTDIYLKELCASWVKKIEKTAIFTQDERDEILRSFECLPKMLLPNEVHITKGKEASSAFGSRVKQQTKECTNEKLKQEVQTEEKELEKVPPPRIIHGWKAPFKQWPKLSLDDPSQIFTTELDREKRPASAMPVTALKEVLNASKATNWKIFSQFLRDDMIITENVIHFDAEDWTTYLTKLSYFYASPEYKTWNRKVSDLLIIHDTDTGEKQVIGLSQADSIVWEKKLTYLSKEEKHRYTYGLCKVGTSTIINRGKTAQEILEYVETEDFKDLLLRWKIFNCTTSFTRDERSSILKLLGKMKFNKYTKQDIFNATQEITTYRAQKDTSNLLKLIRHAQSLNRSTLLS